MQEINSFSQIKPSTGSVMLFVGIISFDHKTSKLPFWQTLSSKNWGIAFHAAGAPRPGCSPQTRWRRAEARVASSAAALRTRTSGVLAAPVDSAALGVHSDDPGRHRPLAQSQLLHSLLSQMECEPVSD